ncbi:MAG: DEAD/DEAH box helicase, partial [Flavobacteriales bacterium]|nr:DEAD/DEAH box helicase [Flavobacteriales bacterium]
PNINSGFTNFILYNHTDLQRKGKFIKDLELTLKDADVVIMDEAHHFRNPGLKGEGLKEPSRYRKLQKFLQQGERSKQLYMLTATPVNNSIHDFRYLIELYTNAQDSYFHEEGIHNLRAYFVSLERQIMKGLQGGDLEAGHEVVEAENALRTDKLFERLVVQRSRTYVKKSQEQHGGRGVLFPERELPAVVDYDLKKAYGDLLKSLEKAFSKETPLFILSIYYPLKYWIGDEDDEQYKSFEEGRQKQVVALIRTLFLKRFESSAAAFEGSCYRLLQRLAAWAEKHAHSKHDQDRLKRWKIKHADLINYTKEHQLELWPQEAEEDQAEEFLSEDILNQIEELDPERFDLNGIMDDTLEDMNQLAEFLGLLRKVDPKKDDKIASLVSLLKKDKVLKQEKVIIFSEFADTARYIEKSLKDADIEGVQRIDGSSTQKQRSEVIHRFAPFYNESSCGELASKGKKEIRVLVATDILAEGLNLQDATRLINYDLHWNPVRLMQRIGRVDRRMDPEIEKRILKDHPDQKALRGKVRYWNFLPPNELDDLLRLFQRVASKTLVISKTLGIEGRVLLTPDDKYDPVKELNEQFDGVLSDMEGLRLEYDQLKNEHPELAAKLDELPGRLFSGREAEGDRHDLLFFCHRIPQPDHGLTESASGHRWSEGAGYTVWSLYDVAGQRVLTDLSEIADRVRCVPDTPRRCKLDRTAMAQVRKQVEKELVKEHLRALQAPVGVEPVLKCWMELN